MQEVYPMNDELEDSQLNLINQLIDHFNNTDDLNDFFLNGLKVDKERLLIGDGNTLYLKVDLDKIKWYIQFLASMPEREFSSKEMRSIKVGAIDIFLSEIVQVKMATESQLLSRLTQYSQQLGEEGGLH